MNIKERLLFIDGYKGLLCITVFLFHYFSTFSFLFGQNIDNLIKDTPLFILIDGVWAVRAFVLLSAFSISLSLSSGRDVPSMVVKRYFRLAFPVGGAILISFLMQRWYFVMEVSAVTGNSWIEAFKPDYSLRELLTNLFLCVPVGLNKYCSVAWMLKFVFWGSFLSIIMHHALKPMSFVKQLLFAGLFVLLTLRVSEFYSLIVIGVLMERNKSLLFLDRSYLFELILLFIVLGSVLFYYKFSLGIGSLISSTFIVLSVLSSKVVRKFLSKRLFVILGYYSFELFLIHCPVIFSLSSYMYINGYNHIVILIITTIAVLLFSYLFKILELKCIFPLQKKLCDYFLE